MWDESVCVTLPLCATNVVISSSLSSIINPFTFTGLSTLTLQAACVVAMSQENAATGDPKTTDSANAIVPTLCQNTKWVDLPHINKLLLCIQGLFVQMTLERECGEGERDDDGHFVLESVDLTHVEH